MWTPARIREWAIEARQRTRELVSDLTDEQLMGPRLVIVNPFLWEIGHVAWFQEKWLLRRSPNYRMVRPDADALYDSTAIPHDTRWDLPLPRREETLRYLEEVRDRALDKLTRSPTREDVYFALLTIFHEDMHTEAFTYTRQTLGYAAPGLRGIGGEPDGDSAVAAADSAPHQAGDVYLAGGPFELGADEIEPFVFDNEKWAHAVSVPPFAIARTEVTQGQFAAFVDDGGYRDDRYWSEEGKRWHAEAQAEHPVYWRREAAGRWLRRNFDQWRALEPDHAVIHVNWYEAEAYCRWAGRRLPTELEWEFAAASKPDGKKRYFPWGSEEPTSRHANLDWRAMGCVAVDGLPKGDSACGCRQMIGNVWEWTSTIFEPYPGFVADPYKEYSAPWFGTHRVLRGGCWATRARLLRNTWRNFYPPARRDVLAGFRTCAVEA